MARTRRLLTTAWFLALTLGLGTAAQAFELGHSGIHVERTPASLLVTRLDPNSPAVLAHLPAPDGRVLRLMFVNGSPALELYRKGELANAFRARSVLVTLGVREREALEERLEGPFVLDLVDSPQSRLKRLIASRQWLKAAALASSGELRPEETEATWARVALEAIHYARNEQWAQAIELGDTVPKRDPASKTITPHLPAWRLAIKEALQEDRRVLAREIVHSGPNPRRVVAKKLRDRQSAKNRKDKNS